MSRKLDAAIAEALGYEVRMKPRPVIVLENGKLRKLPEYSRRGNYMLELIAEMKIRWWNCEIDIPPNYKINAYLYKMKSIDNELVITEHNSCEANTVPLAVALVARKALTGKDWEEDGE